MYLTEPVPAYGTPLIVAQGVRRVVAQNPSVMTYRGTNTYLLDTPQGLVVIDPGPEDQTHLGAVIKALGDTVLAGIIVTHAHHDHIDNTMALREATGALVYRMGTPFGEAYVIDVAVAEGERAFGLDVLHTPGHAPDHICLAREDGILFSGDHVMSWSSSTVSPPNGNMLDYYESLRRLMRRTDTCYLPGHGPPLCDPQAYVNTLLQHRLDREAEIARMLKSGLRSPRELVEALYFKRDRRLFAAAERNVLGHLEKLEREGKVVRSGATWEPVAPPARCFGRGSE